MKVAHDCTSLISRPSKMNRFVFIAFAFLIVMSCCAITDKTSMSILLNSSKQHQAPL